MKIKQYIKDILKKITKTDFTLNLIGFLMYWYTRFVYKTTKWQIIGRENIIKLWEQNQSFILIGWHGRALMFPPFRDYRFPLNALVSLHNDGQMIAGLLKRYGLGIIGGSTNKNARKAALQLMNSLHNNQSICIIPDGPVGPSMHLSTSPIYYAQKTGKPIICITYSVKHCKIINKAWDNMMIPLPFTQGICHFSNPIYIPKTQNDEEFEQYRLQVEKQLNQMNFKADKAMGLTPIKPGHQRRKRNKSTPKEK